MWIRIYRSLVTIRRALNVLIDYARAKAYPVTGGRRKRVQDTENQPVTPTAQSQDHYV